MQSKQYKHQTNNVAAYINQGIALANQQRFEEALASYDHALTIQPQHADALCNRGNALISLHRIEEALASYEQALIVQPNHMQALSNRGNILLVLNRFEAALDNYDQALAIQPNYVDALSNRGAVLIKLNRFEEAVASLDRALALQKNAVEALSNRGHALRQLNRFDEAILSLQQAWTLKPDHADAHWNEALCRLAMGDFALGWQKFEWRWKQKEHIKLHKPRNFLQLLWLGKESLLNQTILLHAEQGFGDTIQFCRYAPLIANMGATVILEVQPALKTLLRNVAGVSRIIAQGETLPPFDYHCPLLSLPLACNTTLDSVPFSTDAATTQPTDSISKTLLSSIKRLLSPSSSSTSSSFSSTKNQYIGADAVHKAIWKNKLGKLDNKTLKTLPRIGLVWSGNPEHANDKNRSIPFSDFIEMIDVHSKVETQQRAQFYCLQKELRANDQALINQKNKQQNNQQNEIAFLGNELKDFSDTAALIDCMDLVITVDTSIAHLAGAMGKPVWILLPFNSDWRWLANRNDSPWYPTARLFKQTIAGDWASVMTMVQQELSLFLSTKNATNTTNTTSTTNITSNKNHSK